MKKLKLNRAAATRSMTVLSTEDLSKAQGGEVLAASKAVAETIKTLLDALASI